MKRAPPDYRALSFTAGDICQVFTIIHKEVLGQYGWASCLLQDVKVFLYIRISVRPVGPTMVTGEVLERFIADGSCKFISFSLARRDGSSVSSANGYGYYWSSTPDEYTAYFLYFHSSAVNFNSDYSRDLGHSVRLVKNNLE